MKNEISEQANIFSNNFKFNAVKKSQKRNT